MKKKFLFSVPALLLFGGAPLMAFAQSSALISINSNIPGMEALSAGPCGWVANFYNFALIIAGILAFGAIVYGGALYATSAGNASKQSEGRSWIWSALIGLLLLAGAYIILYTVNPGLTKCSIPGLSGISSVGGGGSGNGSSTPPSNPGGRCQAPASGPCSTSSLQSVFGSNAATAGGVCNVESNGNPNAQGDKCDDGNYASIGLFQINLSANTIQDPTTGMTLQCNTAFSNAYTGSNPHCTVTNQSLYQQCLTAAKTASANIAKAYSLSHGGTSWSLWGPSTLQQCGL